jgi:hypothetical protein
MIKLSIVNEVNGRTFGSQWESQPEKNEYLDKQITKKSWGKNERHISESEMTEELRSRIISTVVIEATEDQPEQTIHLVKADYVVTETDSESDDDLHNKLAIQARAVEFAKIDVNLMEALAEKELGNLAPMESYLAARQAIKDNNPKR